MAATSQDDDPIRSTSQDQREAAGKMFCSSRDVHAHNKPHERLHGRLSIRFWEMLAANFPWLHALALEVCNLPWRILLQVQLQRSLLDTYLGPHCETGPNGHVIACKRTHARIAGIENFSATFPKASPLDLWIFLQGLKQGEQFSPGSSDTSGMESSVETRPSAFHRQAEL
jgi:hypothetical protein